jgi:hypothetical protein
VADHGLKGKEANKSKKLNALHPGLRAYLSEIEDLGEPIATRIVREVCGLTTLHDTKDDTIYLPMVMSKRSIYKNYCRERGWKLITESNGKYKKEWIGLGPPLSNVVSYAAFCRLWKKEFKHMQVSSKREDICNLCFVVANASKYNFADAQFCEECVSLGSMADDVLVAEVHEEEDMEFEDDVSLPSLASRASVTTSGMSARDNDGVVDGIEVVFDAEKEATKEKHAAPVSEKKFHEAMKHVIMAKAQRGTSLRLCL